MNIFFNRVPKNEPYGGGNQFLCRMVELLQERGHHVTFHLESDLDLIFLIDPRPGDIGYSIEHITAYKQQFPETKILHRINECDKRKNTGFMDQLLVQSAMLADEVVFISQWLSDYFHELGFNGKGHVIYNGCDKRYFVPSTIKKPAEKLRLVTHHWSDNWMKGFDLYTEIDRYLQEHDNFEFTYVGRYCKEYEPKVTRIIEPLHGKALANELQKHDIYVTASRWEPCGMHHIEGAAVGLPVIYHSETGGIKEFCINHGIEYTSFDEFLEAIKEISKNYSGYTSKIDYDFLDINRCCERYYDLLISMSS